jgi:hypothetical protein
LVHHFLPYVGMVVLLSFGMFSLVLV